MSSGVIQSLWRKPGYARLSVAKGPVPNPLGDNREFIGSEVLSIGTMHAASNADCPLLAGREPSRR